MQVRSVLIVAAQIFGYLVSSALAAPPTIEGCPVLPEDSIWNVAVDSLPLDPSSNAYVQSIGSDKIVHPDFGSGLYEGGPIGIPFISVAGTQPGVAISFDYQDESDPGPYPIPANAPIEGGSQSSGDRHVLVLDRGACMLYEMFDSHPQAGGSWRAGSGAVFDLRSHALRPQTWTSADAAGLPILPGLVRYDEVAAGEIAHAIRFTAPQTRRAFVWPARHFASSSTNAALPPMGQRFRLKSSFDISGYHPQVQVILRAMKRYGLILADNGSSWYVSGAPDERWNNDVLRQLRNLHGSDFEAVDVSSLQLGPDSGQARTTAVERAVRADFDGDKVSDIAVWRPTNGYFFILTSSSGFEFDNHLAIQHGLPGDIPRVGDFDGDKKADLAVWRPTDGTWYLRLSASNYQQLVSFQWGLATDLPLTADYDGDGKSDLAVYRASTGTFYVLRSAGGFNRQLALTGSSAHLLVVVLGGPGNDVVSGDFTGDGRDEFVTVWQLLRFWSVKNASGALLSSQPWGVAGDTPLACDWDANGISDRVIVRVADTFTLDWFIAADSGLVYTLTFGSLGDTPNCTGDFDGDGVSDPTLWRTYSGQWFIRQSGNGELRTFDFGLPGDIPLSY